VCLPCSAIQVEEDGVVHDDDLFEETGVTGFGTPKLKLRTDLLNRLRAEPLRDDDDLTCAIVLTRLVRSELEAFGTGGGERLVAAELELVQRTLRAVLQRVGIDPSLPWRNFTGFKTYWLKNDASGSWQARRELIANIFDSVEDELDRQEEAEFRVVLADAVSPHAGTGWPKVDEEITELKRRFRTAATPQDYRDVGNRCVAVLEALSRTVYDPSRHLRHGEDEPPADKTKQRLGRYVEDSLAGKDNEAVRAVPNKVIELAHSVKHSTAPARREAGIAADAVILLANILRRVDQEF
jgi:hypothetical protein